MAPMRALLFAALVAPHAGFARASRGLAAARVAPRGGVEIAQESEDFVAASQLFVEAFWRDKAEQELKNDQRKRLQREQLDEFKRRYGFRKGREDSRRRSAFFVATEGDAVSGCAGVELDGAAGAVNAPVLANLAVGPAGRRKGLGARLVKSCESSAKDWGCAELTLVVEASNAPAKRLYEKLGYKETLRTEDAKTLSPRADGRVVASSTTTITMSKSLRGGLPGGPLLPAAAALAAAAAAAVSLDLVPGPF